MQPRTGRTIQSRMLEVTVPLALARNVIAELIADRIGIVDAEAEIDALEDVVNDLGGAAGSLLLAVTRELRALNAAEKEGE